MVGNLVCTFVFFTTNTNAVVLVGPKALSAELSFNKLC